MGAFHYRQYVYFPIKLVETKFAKRVSPRVCCYGFDKSMEYGHTTNACVQTPCSIQLNVTTFFNNFWKSYLMRMNNIEILRMNNILVIIVIMKISQVNIFYITVYKRKCKLKIFYSFGQIKTKIRYVLTSSYNRLYTTVFLWPFLLFFSQRFGNFVSIIQWNLLKNSKINTWKLI